MLSIHGKVLGLAMVMAALGTGCAVDAANDADLDEAGVDEVEMVDSTAEALEADASTRGGYTGQVGVQGPVDLGQAPVGIQAPVGQLGQGPVGQGPVGQGPVGQGPTGVP